MTDVVVIGAGQAGAALVAKLRALGHDGRITMVGAEPEAPYQRPPLSKAYLLGDMPLDRLLLRSPGFWAENRIDLRPGRRATVIDRGTMQVLLDDGTALPYDILALTTGASPRRLPATIGGTLPGVHVMRGLADADRLAPDLRPGARALIVGGGYIGLEAAAVCSKRGLEVTLIEAAPRILGRVAAPETADWFRALHRAHGVDIRESTALAGLEGSDRVAAARLACGTILPVDLVIAGIGITPDTDLAAAAGLSLDNGIATDAFCRTSDPAIFAAGDCASFPGPEGRLRLESVQNAIDQAENAAANICGANQPYRPQPWFWSDQYDVKLQIAGLNTGYDRVVARSGADDGSGDRPGAARSHWYFRGDRLLAVDAMNDPRAFMTAKRLLAIGRSPAAAAVADPSTDLRTLIA